MAQGEFWVERQNWARWPRVLKVNRVTDGGTETRSYVRKGADWEAKDYATRKIAELQAENAKLRKLVRAFSSGLSMEQAWCSGDCKTILDCHGPADCPAERLMDELGIEVDND